MSEVSQNKLPPPLVTVVIPVYNYAERVQRAIESVKAQSVTNLECIIVDDGSTDNTRETVEAAIADDLRFRYIYQENAGVAEARNNGVFSGTGKYVCCLDADDAIAPSFLEVCVNALEKDPSLGIAYTGLWFIKPDGEEGLSPWPGDFNYDDQLQGKNQIPTCNVTRRVIWEQLGGQRQRYAPKGAGEEDAEFWLRIGAYGWNAKKVTDEGLFIYSWLSGRVSGNRKHQMVDYRLWHPWTRDGKHPFASLATPEKFAHPVRQYDEPVISVIIPVGPGHEKHVWNALDSLDAQTFRQWEAIVVWDGERQDPDEYERIRKAFPHAFHMYFRGEPSGAGFARNRGASVATAPFLLFLDADDHLYPEALEVMLDEWQAEEAIIYSDYVGKQNMSELDAAKFKDRLLFYDSETQRSVIRFYSARYDYDRAVAQPKVDGNGYLYVWNLITSLTPAAWHHEIGGFDEEMESWEDWDYWIRMARAGKCFRRVQEPLVVYRFDSGTRRERGLQGWESLIKYLLEKYSGAEIMPCGCRDNGRPNSPTSPSLPVSTKESAMRAINESPDSDFVLAEYTSPNRGSHRVIGMSTGIDYKYHKGGDQFLVHREDMKVTPHLFREIEQRRQLETAPVKPPPPPEVLRKPEAPPVHQPVDDTPIKSPENGEQQPERNEQPEEKQRLVVADKPFDPQTIPGINAIMAQKLNAMGVHTLRAMANLSVDDLQTIKGIGPAKANMIHDHLQERVAEAA